MLRMTFTVAAAGLVLGALVSLVVPKWDRRAIATPSSASSEAADKVESSIGVSSPPSTPTSADVSAAFDAALAAEVRDSTWASSAEAAFAELYARNGVPGAELRRVECRSTICRLVVAYGDTEARDAFFDGLPPEPFARSHFFVFAEGAGDQETEIYVARVGHALPRIDAASVAGDSRSLVPPAE
jgi:hypothetical protein